MRFWPFGKRSASMEGGDEFAQVLAQHLVAQAFGEGDILEASQFGGLRRRDQFIRFPPVARAVGLIGAITGQMATNGGLTVRDSDDRKVMNRRVNRVLELLSHSPDGGLTPALYFVEDAMADYLLDGNALIRPLFNAPMMPMALVRYRPQGAYTLTDDGPLTYQAQPALRPDGMLHLIPGREMVHVRWPHLESDRLGSSARQYFAVPTVTLFAQQFIIGLLQDAYVRKRYQNAPVTQLLLSQKFENTPNAKPDNRRAIQDTLAEVLRNNPGLAVFDVDATQMDSAPVHEAVLDAGSKQVEVAARIYGLPPPLLALPVGQWSRGVNEQVMKMAWRTGLRIHVDRFLAACKTRFLLPGERFEVDPSEFVRGDASGVAELLMAMQGDAQRDPVASREELRHLAGLPREPDGEIPTTKRDNDGPDEPPPRRRLPPPTDGGDN